MDGIKITTSQNVELEYEAAGVGNRLLASLLDGLFIMVYAIAVILIVGLSLNGFNEITGDDYLLNTLLILASLPIVLYHFLSETFMNGQSFGKKIMKIKVVKLDGTQAGVSSYMLRSLLRIIDFQISNGVVALVSVAVSKNSQRLGDMAAGTTVIALNSKVSLRDTILYKKIDNYKIVFVEVALLADKDMAIIKEILDHSITNNKRDNLHLLAQKVKTKMGVSTLMDDELFLKTVLLDYSHYQFEK